MKTLTSIALVVLLGACSVTKPYQAPRTEAASFPDTQSAAFVSRNPDLAWWQQFGDQELARLETRALSANLDLRIAADRVREARAVFVGSEFDLAPHVPLSAGYADSREQVPGFGASRIDATSYSVGFDASWEIDLFGHVRQSIVAARADLGAEQADLDGARVTVAAEVARNYFELRGTQRRLDVAHRNLESQKETLALTELRYDAGRVTELDVASSKARFKAIEATLPILEAAAKRASYRLAVLTGERPGALDPELTPAAVATYAKALPIGDPEQLLARRPDVRAAERRYAGAYARTGVATADLYPRISVTGFIGFLSGDFGKLFRASGADDARAWSVSPTLSWSAFDFGSAHARLRAQKAAQDSALASYQSTVLTALEDTQNAFVAYASQQQQLRTLGEQEAASLRAAEIATIQYREGAADFLTLLDAQRTALAAEDEVAQAEAATNVAVVAVYKALGGAAAADPSPGRSGTY